MEIFFMDLRSVKEALIWQTAYLLPVFLKVKYFHTGN